MSKKRSLTGSDTRSDFSGSATLQKLIRTMPRKMLSNKAGGPICCDQKKGLFLRYSLKNNYFFLVLLSRNSFINDIAIVPRFLILHHHKKDFGCRCQQTIEVTNKSVIPREFTVFTDFEDSSEMTMTISGSQNLLTGESFSIEMHHVQKKRVVHNARYNIYIQAEHPNMTLEVPIFCENFFCFLAFM